jgi:hypothetical protein
VAADANLAGQMYPDQSLYPADSVPAVVKRINNCLLRADQLNHAEGNNSVDYLQPIVADAEAGFGGVLNAFELMKGMIEAGATEKDLRATVDHHVGALLERLGKIPDKAVLGCTHFPLVESLFRGALPIETQILSQPARVAAMV